MEPSNDAQRMFIVTSFAAILACIYVGVAAFVLYRRRDRLSMYFSLYILSVALWVGANAAADIATTDFTIRLASGLCLIGGMSFVSLYWCFIDSFLTEQPIVLWKKILFFIPALFFALIAFTPIYVTQTIILLDAPAQIIPGNVNYLVLLNSTVGIIYGLIRLVRAYPRSSYQKRKQIFYLTLGFSLMLVGGIIFTILLPFRGDYRFFTLGSTCSIVAIVLTSYAIFRHRLLDIAIVIQRGLIYTVLSIGIIGLYLTTLFVALIFFPQDTVPFIVSSVITTLVGIWGAPIVERTFRVWTDPFFFKHRYQFSDASHELSTIINSANTLEDITNRSAVALKKILRIESVCFSLLQEYTKYITPSHNSAVTPVATCRTMMSSTEPIRSHTSPFALSAPLLLETTMVGTLSLGPKRSGEDYRDEDIQLVQIFCRQSAVALSKALLYQEVLDYSQNLMNKVEERTKEIKALQEGQSQLMFDISHELQTPLTIIKGEIARLHDAGIDETKLRPFEKSIDRISSFITALLQLAALDTKGGVLSHDPFDLSALVTEVVEYVTVLAAASEVSLRASIEPSISMHGDREQIERLVTNLLSNALKYIANDRRVTLTISSIDHATVLTITDTGVGISPDHLPLLFKRFYRLPTTGQSPGTGLGLAMCERIVKNHGGTITIDSILSQGTTVTVRFPH